MTPAEAKQWLKANHIKYILAQFVDIHGSAKAKAVPAEHLEMVLTDGAGFAGFALWGFGMGPHGPDYMAVGDLSTLMPIPWMPGFARMATYGHVYGKPYPYDSRVALKVQLDKLAAQGMTLYTGIEPEFMLLKRRADNSLGPWDATDSLEKPCYDYKGLARSTDFLDRLVSAVRQVGLDVYQIDHEDANGQFEVNFTYSDAMTSADRIILFRMAASEIAREFGAICSFMPKPMSDRTGSGMHIHLSIGDEKKKNLFQDDKDRHNLGLSAMAYQFLGGILHHAPALAALACPSVNSYKRLVVGRSFSGATWAPAYISYGDNNRTSMVRVPYGRLEFRLADSGCNPYLATAALLAAGLDGVERKFNPGEPHNFNHYTKTDAELKELGIKVLPQSLSEAMNALEADALFGEALGKEFVAEFIRLKRMEWVDYHRHVSDWEVRRYLEFF
jgi:glutamine synthetase